MYCRKCGANIPQGKRFCVKCGAPAVSAARQQPQQSQQPTGGNFATPHRAPSSPGGIWQNATSNTYAPQQEYGASAGGSHQPKRKKGRGKLVAALVAALVAVGVGCGVYFGLMGGSIAGFGKNGNELSSAEEALELIANLNGGELPEIYYDEETLTPRYIPCAYSSRSVKSADDALATLYDVAGLYGFSNPEEELSLKSEETNSELTLYRFQQVYSDIPVYGHYLVVGVDSSGNAVELYGKYRPNVEVDILWNVDSDEAEAAVSASNEYSEQTILGSEEAIYVQDGEAYLCWDVSAGVYHVFVDAVQGDIVGSEV